MTRLPVISLVTTVICLGALIVGMFNTAKAVRITIAGMIKVFDFLPDEYAYVETYRNSYMLVACWTVCVALAALVYDFMMTSNTRPYRQTWASLTFIVALVGTFFIWLYVLRTAIFISFIYSILKQVCDGPQATPGWCFSTGVDWFTSKQWSTNAICDFPSNCDPLIYPTAALYENVVLSAAVVTGSLISYMLCFAPLYNYYNRPSAPAATAIRSFGGRRGTSTSRSRSSQFSQHSLATADRRRRR